jgi:hypothetical protein
MINCVLAIISWGYFNIQRSWMDYLDPLDYENTLNVIYHDLIMKNIAFWAYIQIMFSLHYALLHPARQCKTHRLNSGNI